MRIARFRRHDGTESFGVIDGEQVTDVGHGWPSYERALPDLVRRRSAGDRLRLTDVTLLPPIGTHAKIFCVGYNYATHATETGKDLPAHPTLFTRYPDTLVGHGTPIVRPADNSTLDWEGELAVVIGRPGRRIPVSEAARHIAGLTCFADNSVRDWQFHSTQATAGKNWPASGACGPWLVTLDECADVLELTTRVNGTLVQHDTTANLAFPIAELVAYVSAFTVLAPGDVIATGTPGGVGFRRQPPVYLDDGDLLEVEVSGVGVLCNPVRIEVLGALRCAG